MASRRESTWSRCSNRLEEIVAQLMKPISDIRCLDIDLSSLLEEYLTEAGLHALAVGVEPAVPNFVELAVLLQHLANLYGRKVDFLYVAVVFICDSLNKGTEAGGDRMSVSDAPDALALGSSTPRPGRRRRLPSDPVASEFLELDLEPCSGAQRGTAPARPPPALPRSYVELEPRVLPESALQLYDYAGEPVGLPADFYVTWRLQNGLLVDELEDRRSAGEPPPRRVSLGELQAAINATTPPRRVSLGELQAAIDATTPPRRVSLGELQAAINATTPPRRVSLGELQAAIDATTPPPPQSSPSQRSGDVATPIPCEPNTEVPAPSSPSQEEDGTSIPLPCEAEVAGAPPLSLDVTAISKSDKRRRADFSVRELIKKCFTAYIDAEVRYKLLNTTQDFCLTKNCFKQVFLQHTKYIVQVRRMLVAPESNFRGFELTDVGGFRGWSCEEAETARLYPRPKITHLEPQSEDDGFFERSSLDYLEESAMFGISHSTSECTWQAASAEKSNSVDMSELVGRVLDACPSTGVDVSELARRVLDALPPVGAAPFVSVLRAAARTPKDVSRLLYASLFLTNAGNVEIVPGPPLSMNSFSLRTLNRDPRLYITAAAADQPFLR